MNPNAVGQTVYYMVFGAIHEAIKSHEVDLGHPGRATDDALAPPTMAETAAANAIGDLRMALVGHLVVPDPGSAADDIVAMVRTAVKEAVGRHEVDLGHPGRSGDAAGDAAETAVDALAPTLVGHLTPIDPSAASNDISQMIVAGIRAGIGRHEVDLGHPGRAAGVALDASTAAGVVTSAYLSTLVGNLT